jgi:hypothetical protein
MFFGAHGWFTFGSLAGQPFGFTTGHDGGGAASGGGRRAGAVAASGIGGGRYTAASIGCGCGGGGGGATCFGGDELQATTARITAARSTRPYYGINVNSRESAFVES